MERARNCPRPPEAATLGEAVTIVAAGGSNAGNSLRMMGSLDSEGGRKTF